LWCRRGKYEIDPCKYLREKRDRPDKLSWPASGTRPIISDYGLPYYIGEWDGDTLIGKPRSVWTL